MTAVKSKPAFIPKSDQIDFSDVRWAPVINCIVEHQGKILLVKRSEKLRLYPGYWNGISGFLDDQKNLEEKVYEELHEEVGITKDQIVSIQLGQVFDQEEPKYTKTWVVHPVLVRVRSNAVQLDWEANDYIWLTIDEARGKKLVPGCERVLDVVELMMKGDGD